MVGGRAATIAAVCTRDHCDPGFGHEFFGAVFSASAVAVAEAGYEVMALGQLPGDSDYVRRAAKHAAAGVLVLGDGRDLEIDALLSGDLPVVGVHFRSRATGRHGHNVGKRRWDAPRRRAPARPRAQAHRISRRIA
jgi:hypothetical protein